MAKTMTNVCVIGLGYVGLPLAVRFAERTDLLTVHGVDTCPEVLAAIESGRDPTGVLTPCVAGIYLPHIRCHRIVPNYCDVYIICVPTPAVGNQPDYSYVEAAVQSLQGIPADASVVLESTVAPGATEQYLVGKLPTNRIAYSPERIDPQPGKYYRMFDTAKMVASTDPVNREFLAELYQLAFREVCTFDNPRILELAKCFENTQRDMNIALMNELSIHCHSRGVPLGPVLNALSHKFNALPFHPGMVGGHCIAVDPYYLADWYEKNDLAYHAYSLPTYSRRTNETYIHYIANVIAGLSAGNPVLIVGRTYKPDVPDTRNSGALRLVSILHEHYGIQADTYDVLFEDSVPKGPYNVVIGAVNHRSGQGYSLRERLPVSKETAVFVNVGRFTHEQTQSFDRVITL